MVQAANVKIAPGVEVLVALGRERGYVTYDDLNDRLPPEWLSADRLDDVLILFGDLDIPVVENELDTEAGHKEDAVEVADDGESTPAKSPKEKIYTTEFVEDIANLDPVRMYLREMGHVSLLTREGEVDISRRIELGQLTILKFLVSFPHFMDDFNVLIENIKSMEKFFLSSLFAADKLNIINNQNIYIAIFLFNILHSFITNRPNNIVNKCFRSNI